MSYPVMLAKELELGMKIKKDTSNYSSPPIGWIGSEKFDGYRCFFFYKEIGGEIVGIFSSRNYKGFTAPEWFLKSMPSYEVLGKRVLDGELWAGRDNFEFMGLVRKKKPIDEEWYNITYQVYDIIDEKDRIFKERIKILKDLVKFNKSIYNIKLKNKEIISKKFKCPLVYCDQITIKSIEHMKEYYQNIIDNDGEGIMIKHPESKYENGRSSYMLKVKPSIDREAIIIDYKMGDPNSKYKGLLGSFICKPLINHDTYMSIDEDDNHIFTLSGMDDEIRNNYQKTHSEGTIITYECSGFTNKGLPRFGRYMRKRDDVIIKEHIEDTNLVNNLEKVKEIFQFLEEYYKKNYDIMRKTTYSKINKLLRELKSDEDLSQGNLSSIKGIGKGTIDRIIEIIDTGTLKEYEKLKNKKSPLEDFLKIHGVGRQHAKKLLSEGFSTIDDLRKCENIQDYLNDTQLKGLKYYDDIQQRIPYNEIKSLEIHFMKILEKIDKDSELTIAGSYRRKNKDSGDIDIFLKSENKKTYNKFIDVLKENNLLVEDLARGNKKYMGLGKSKNSKWCRRIDIMYTKPEEYPFAVLYFTGSGEFNERMRGDALKQGFTMNEYGIKSIDGNSIDNKFDHEGDIFRFLNYKYIQPENRK